MRSSAKHVNADGTIRLAWRDRETTTFTITGSKWFGNDVITTSIEEGDKIEISAHTAEVKSIEHLDSNGDGRADYSVITVISQQALPAPTTRPAR